MLDLVMAAVLGFGIWRGLTTGALMQVVGTAGWVLAFVFATAVMGPFGDAAAASLGVSGRVAPLLGFVVAFGLVVIGLTVAAHTLRKMLKAIKLGAVDALAGAVIGFVRMLLGISIVLRVTGVSILPGGEPLLISREAREASLLYEPIQTAAPVVWDTAKALLPGAQERLGSLFNSFDE